MKTKIIFLPGLSYRSDIWNKVIKFIPNDKFSIITLDIPEYGTIYNRKRLNFDTFPNFLHDQINKLRIKPPFILVGQSLGGLISVKYTAKHPKNVLKLVLISTPLRKPESKVPLSYKITLSALYKYKPLDYLLQKIATVNAQFLDRIIEFFTGATGAFSFEFLKRVDPQSVVSCLNDLFIYDFSKDVSRIDQEVLIVYGSLDKFILNTSGTDFYKNFKRKEIKAVKSDHSIPISCPAKLASYIMNFIEK